MNWGDDWGGLGVYHDWEAWKLDFLRYCILLAAGALGSLCCGDSLRRSLFTLFVWLTSIWFFISSLLLCSSAPIWNVEYHWLDQSEWSLALDLRG